MDRIITRSPSIVAPAGAVKHYLHAYQGRWGREITCMSLSYNSTRFLHGLTATMTFPSNDVYGMPDMNRRRKFSRTFCSSQVASSSSARSSNGEWLDRFSASGIMLSPDRRFPVSRAFFRIVANVYGHLPQGGRKGALDSSTLQW